MHIISSIQDALEIILYYRIVKIIKKYSYKYTNMNQIILLFTQSIRESFHL